MTKFIKVTLLAIALFSFNHLSAQTLNDSQLKQNIVPIENPLSVISRINPVIYQYNVDEYPKMNLPKGKQTGFLTENLSALDANLVKKTAHMVPAGKNSFKNVQVDEVNLQALIPVLVGAIQDQQKQIEALKSELRSKTSSK
ncbi:tail fiber domain-containing protein [Pedobacter sp. HMF7647]|uniref:Tail fiber domain-containing protein n=1 Tax=Hufsiella arboris TaxID=2695275 RepID=A0A7K1YDS6_9SPHI|nr:tail fiber domain-containing protein [Hufsiella arboris]MXV52757.1 tail fiber domain-containing protein [Hufsiella arboris]